MTVDKKKLEKRLLGYATLAGAVIAANPSAQAAIIKTDPADLTGQKTLTIDFDNDFSTDLTILAGPQSIWGASSVVAGGNSIVLVGNYSNYIWYASALNYGQSIGASRTFGTLRTSNLQFGGVGDWAGAGQKYLGVKFKIDGSFHYGWVKMACSSNPYPYTLSLYEYAYESVAGVSIQAGADASLPVQLTSFTATVDNSGIDLQWATESETDNLGFILERQLIGESEWSIIDSYRTNPNLAGQGNTTSRNEYTYLDMDVVEGSSYRYRLSDVDIQGNVVSKRIIEVTTKVVPDGTELLSTYPNPFNPGTTIQYKLADDAKVSLDVIDITGRTIRSIVKQQQASGNYSYYWDGADNQGRSAPSGIYMLVLKAGNQIKTQKVTRLR